MSIMLLRVTMDNGLLIDDDDPAKKLIVIVDGSLAMTVDSRRASLIVWLTVGEITGKADDDVSLVASEYAKVVCWRKTDVRVPIVNELAGEINFDELVVAAVAGLLNSKLVMFIVSFDCDDPRKVVIAAVVVVVVWGGFTTGATATGEDVVAAAAAATVDVEIDMLRLSEIDANVDCCWVCGCGCGDNCCWAFL